MSPEIVKSLEHKRVTNFAVGHCFVIALGQTLPIETPAQAAKGASRNRNSPLRSRQSQKQKRLHSANPISGQIKNKSFASLNRTATNPIGRRGGSPLRQEPMKFGEFKRPSVKSHEIRFEDQRRSLPQILPKASPVRGVSRSISQQSRGREPPHTSSQVRINGSPLRAKSPVL